MLPSVAAIIDAIESGWPQKRLLVVGDVMLDKYLWGHVERVSPEAPVPVVRSLHQTEQPGGAANVALNVAGLGADVTIAGFIGQDDEGARLSDSLRASGATACLVAVPGMPTTSKLRILSGSQQMLRVDTETRTPPPADAHTELLRTVAQILPEMDAVILSDYAKGVLDESACSQIIESAARLKIPVLVDPKNRDFSRYRRATTICPNLQELSAAVLSGSTDLESLFTASETLLKELELEYLVVTMSDKGIALIRNGSRIVAPAVAREVFDVSGAGDTVVAVLGLCAASGLPVEAGVELANMAAGIVVSKIGTVPVQKSELLSALTTPQPAQSEDKVLSLAKLVGRVAGWRAAGQKVVFTNGCFDLLHVGHITVLERARREGDRLVVGLNSDASVRALKGSNRPIIGENERAQVMAALAAVDAVVIFDEPTPIRLIEALRPHVIVKGGDYSEAAVVGGELVRSWGGRVKIVPTVEGYSTTRLIEKSMAPS